MKIVVVGFTKMSYMPYMHFYIDHIRNNNDIHLIYWQRDESGDVPPPLGVVTHPFCHNMSDAIPLRRKLPLIFKFGRFAKNKIKELSPDFLIVLHSTTAFTIRNLLYRNYSGKYIFDFRDITYERTFKFYRNAVSKVVKHSALTFTSSDAYREFLPDSDKIKTSHNILLDSFKNREQYSLRKKRQVDQPIRIAFWGLLRHLDLNIQLISQFGGDKRFELHYYGRAQAEMLDLMETSSLQYDNIFYHGVYTPNERDEFAKNTDIIHNLYSNIDLNMPLAMANKYYDGLMYYIPQLVMRESFMGMKCNEYKIGLEINPLEGNCTDKVWDYYQRLDFDDFIHNCDEAMHDVMTEYNNGCEMIARALDNCANK